MKLSFFQILTLIFITLKLTGYILWSWWWVLSPLWITFIFLFSVAMITELAKTKTQKVLKFK